MGHQIFTVGHRGCMVPGITENSLRAFEKAIDAGYSMIELDVYACKSGELIVMHDETIDRTTTGNGCVDSLTLDEIKKYTLNDGQPIPTLSEVLDFIDKRCIVNIELKGTNTAQKAIDVINDFIKYKSWSENLFLVSSFDHYLLAHIKKEAPHIPISAIMDGIIIGYAEFGTRVGAGTIAVSSNHINQNFVDDAHKRGLKVLVWTINSQKMLKKMLELKVDGILTDTPFLYCD